MITFLIAEIAVEPGWAVGTVPLDDPTVDCELLLDAHGRPWVPGSSLAGSLRAHLRRLDTETGGNLETTLMGSRPSTDRGSQTSASPLWFLGTRFTPDPAGPTTGPGPRTEAGSLAGAGQLTEVVGQTAIDRRRGAAAENSLRYSRVVAAGGTLTAYLRHDGPLTDAQVRAIAGWRPAIGRDRTKGGGRARLRTLRHGTIDPAEDMATWLRYAGEALVEAVATSSVSGPEPAQPWLQARLSVTDALLVGDPRPAGPAGPRTRDGQPLVPGSAWKGLFRSRAEYILRSLYGEDAACQQATGCDSPTCLTCDVFGRQGSRGILAFPDTPVEDAVQSPPRTQVGIDRVTGGARNGLLYRTAPVTAGRLHLRIDALAEQVPEWVRTVLRHVLRDLDDGLIGIGSRTTRGMGTLRLVDPLPPPGPVQVPGRTPLTSPGPAPLTYPGPAPLTDPTALTDPVSTSRAAEADA